MERVVVPGVGCVLAGLQVPWIWRGLKFWPGRRRAPKHVVGFWYNVTAARQHLKKKSALSKAQGRVVHEVRDQILHIFTDLRP